MPVISQFSGHRELPGSIFPPTPHRGRESVPSSSGASFPTAAPAPSPQPWAGSVCPSPGRGHTPRTEGLEFKGPTRLDAARDAGSALPLPGEGGTGSSAHGALTALTGQLPGHRAPFTAGGQRKPPEMPGREERRALREP